ncbi:MAG: carbohydrate kinase family protein [Chloroflexota bacterium]|nr:carbohydrate kinase family protein [Chloroflexota bacterium]
MNKIDALFIGGSSVDIILRVPRLPSSDEKMLAELIEKQPGGFVSNTACAAARLGLHSAWIGTVGNDEFGRILLAGFKAYGVDTSLANVHAQSATDFTVILLEPSGERTILVVPTSDGPPHLKGEAHAILHDVKLVYLPPYKPEWFLPLADVVHAGGGLIAIDVEASSPVKGSELDAVLRNTDVVFCNPRGLALMTGSDDTETGAARVLVFGPECVCITLGERGASAFSPNNRAYAPGFEVPVVDTTGAGDCFHAAFLCEYLSGKPLAEVLQFANAAAALSIQKIGPRAGLPTRLQVESFIRSRGSEI